jgi:hypothetical protein
VRAKEHGSFIGANQLRAARGFSLGQTFALLFEMERFQSKSKKMSNDRGRAETLTETEGNVNPRQPPGNGDPAAHPLTELGRRKPHLPAKERAEAAQRREADVEANLRDGPCRNNEQILGTLDPNAREEIVRRFAERGPECAQKMPCRQIHFLAQIVQGERLIQAISHQIANLAEFDEGSRWRHVD